MSRGAGLPLRESDLFWIPCIPDTEWIFTRLWNVVTYYNVKYGFDLSDDIGQAQLTRYRPGQHYDWHMDLGPEQLSLRKITAVVELAPRDLVKGGGLEIFYSDSGENKVDLDAGDIVMFPSFVMHRASMVKSGTRWSFVLWLNGRRPLT
jgi:PKHD-type hydroxylase